MKERRAAGARKSVKVTPPVAPKAIRRKPPARRKAEDLAEWSRKAGRMPEVRRDLVDRVRAEIDAGQYETPEKLDAAVDRLLEDLADA